MERMEAAMPNDFNPLLSPAERFGRELARFRKDRGITQRALARHLDCSPSLIGHIETGSRNPAISLAEACDRYFELDTEFFVRLARRVHRSPYGAGWYLRWLEEIEPNAVILRTWDPLLIPGLLQTEAYARYVFLGHFSSSEDEVEEQVAARMERQRILNRPKPPGLYVLMDEWVLKRPIGTGEVMHHQLRHLATIARHRHVTVQVVPYNTLCTDGFSSSFVIAELPDAPTTVIVDSAGEGEVSDEHKVVSLIVDRYDRLRTQAYSADESLDRIEEAAQQWKPET
ncbi:helix-turn-helix transcriptional regulator [Thermopolyspora sp. NPDC052614]|uniref:helix-turn-helix domain-containing protein n=1 Tax=Thermopolyspora sp. NPDC052614 TaxID=3155682 RepID=UPI00342B1E89